MVNQDGIKVSQLKDSYFNHSS